MLNEDYILANAASFLIEGHEEDAASVLLSCNLSLWPSGDTWMDGDEVIEAFHIKFSGPRVAFDILNDFSHPTTTLINKALEAVIPENIYLKHTTVQFQTSSEMNQNWREELLEIARGKNVHNQAAIGEIKLVWNNLYFRSKSEVKIAEALDKAKVLFFPNCRGRLGLNNRLNKEADFLICFKGKWGILEVDGEPFHPPSRAVHDHARDRLFKEHGIKLIEHFDSTECFKNPDKVVNSFLRMLEIL